MTTTLHRAAPDGTFRVGEIFASFADLCDRFGPPHCADCDPMANTGVEWWWDAVEGERRIRFTVYRVVTHAELAEHPNQIMLWTIGGRSHDAADYVRELLA